MPALLVLGASAAPFDWPKEGIAGPCGDSCGSVRSVVRVPTDTVTAAAGSGACAVARVPWRRRDRGFEAKRVVIVPAALCSGGPCPQALAVRNLVRLNVSTRAVGVLAFHPTHGPGEYHVYWLPYSLSGLGGVYNVQYYNDTSAETTDRNWAAAHGLDAAGQAANAWHSLPEAEYVREEYRSGFEARTEMEKVATDAEVQSLAARMPAGSSFMVFPEDRTMQIRMQDFGKIAEIFSICRAFLLTLKASPLQPRIAGCNAPSRTLRRHGCGWRASRASSWSSSSA